jgi:hypothetical protein
VEEALVIRSLLDDRYMRAGLACLVFGPLVGALVLFTADWKWWSR